MLSNATIIKNDDGSSNVALFLDGEAYLAHSSHANYKSIIEAITSDDQAADYEALFDTGKLVQGKFEEALAQVEDQALSERIAIRNGEVTLDGDPVSGALEEQILHFVREGADFGPLIRFYEKLVTNPLGNVREGVYSWAQANGLTITPEGNLLGYKSVSWDARIGKGRPSHVSNKADRVNNVEVVNGQYMWIGPGDVVEMPRSMVLNAPSQACGDGLHIGTFDYAQGFYGGNTVLLVEFNPRDIVSLPDSASTWKLRVCRFTVIDIVTEALDVPVYMTATAPEPVEEAGDNDDFPVGTRVVDVDGDRGKVTGRDEFRVRVEYDDDTFGVMSWEEKDLAIEVDYDDTDADDASEDRVSDATEARSARKHGKGGRTSQAAKGNGLNPAQDRKTGQFVNGRPGSGRDRSTGRFTA